MSFRPVIMWLVQCDGLRGCGPCAERFRWHGDAGLQAGAHLNAPKLSADQLHLFNAEGWMVLPDGRHQCPAHVAMAEQMARTALEGPPFGGDPAR